MTEEEYVMSLAKVKFEQKWDSRRLAEELGSSYVWMMKVMCRKAPVSRQMGEKIKCLIDRYHCSPWSDSKKVA